MPCPSGEDRRYGEGAALLRRASINLSGAALAALGGTGRSGRCPRCSTLRSRALTPVRGLPSSSQLRTSGPITGHGDLQRHAAGALQRGAPTPQSRRIRTTGTARCSGSAPIRTTTGTTTSSTSRSRARSTPRPGYVIDINVLKQLVEEKLLGHLDHKNLNLDVPQFRDRHPDRREHRGRTAGETLRPVDARRLACCAFASGRPRATMSTTKGADGRRGPRRTRSRPRSATSSPRWARTPTARGWSRRPSGWRSRCAG